jgi:hypothetical protein
MLYDDLLELAEERRPRRKPRGNERTRARRVENYLYEAFEEYRPNKHKSRFADDGENFEDNHRERRRDPYWKRRREEIT